MGNRFGFRFDLFVTLRADQLIAVGYTNHDGVVDEIRIGTSEDGARVLWSRNVDEKWHVSQPASATPLIDAKRFSAGDLNRLQTILRQSLGDAGAHGSLGKGGNH